MEFLQDPSINVSASLVLQSILNCLVWVWFFKLKKEVNLQEFPSFPTSSPLCTASCEIISIGEQSGRERAGIAV